MVRRLGCAALIPKRDAQDPNVCEKHIISARGIYWCKRLWVLKNSLHRNPQKSERLRMPCCVALTPGPLGGWPG